MVCFLLFGSLEKLANPSPAVIPKFQSLQSMLSGIVASVWVVDAQITPEIPGDRTVHMDIEGQYIHREKRSGEMSEGGDIRRGEHTKQ